MNRGVSSPGSTADTLADAATDASAGSARHTVQWVVAICLGLSVSLGAFLLVQRWERERVERAFDAEARNAGQNLAVTLDQDEDALYSLRSVFTASEEVTYAEFRTAAADLRERHPGIQMVEWLPRVLDEQRAATEARARAEVHPDFQIQEREVPQDGDETKASLRPAGKRAEYLAVLYMEPSRGSESWFGFDHFTGPYQRAIARARDTGVIAATRRISWRAETPSWYLILPIYGPGPMPKTPEERQRNFRGCLKGSFRLSELVTTSIARVEREALEILLVDHTPGSMETYLISFSGDTVRVAPPPTEAEFRAGLHFARPLPVAGREWVALFRPSAAWLAAQDTGYSSAFLGSGLLLTGLLAWGLRGAQRRSTQVREMVAQRTSELNATQSALREDIRRRASAERALRASEERYRAFIANSGEAIWRFEFDPPVKIDQPEDDLIEEMLRTARVAECNDATARMYGFQRGEEMIGLALDTILPDSVAANLDHLRAYVRSGFRLENSETQELDRAGQTHIFLNNMVGIVEDGCLHRTWGTQRDVTAQRRTESTRQENEARLRLALAAADLGTWEWDPAGDRIIFSEGTERIFGLAPGSFDGRPETASALIHPEDRVRTSAAAQRAVAAAAEYHSEHRIVRPDGTVRWVVARGDTIPEGPGKPTRLLGAIMDVTEEHQRATETALMEKKLQETQKLESLGILAGGIAHDFNNLLTGILGNASLARMDLPRESPVQGNLEAIETVAQRAAELCKQMLAYSGKGRFLAQRLDLSVLVQETAELIQVSISKNVTLKFSLSETLPAISADATQIRQIIMNLVINASDAIGEKRGQITIRSGVVQADQAYLANTYLSPELSAGEYVFLEISDDGCGMDAETQAKIFDPFFSTKFTGRGLGLAAVLGIVRGHRGALRVYSEPGKGSTFKLLLPGVSGRSEAAATAEGFAAPWQVAGTVLVIDDEEIVRQVTTRMLHAWGFQTETAGNGREALEIFRPDPTRFTAILLDLTMPEMDGTATFTELRRISPAVRVLLMSGFNEQDAISGFAGKGLAGFLQKPFKPDALQAKLRAILEGSDSE